MAIVSPNRAVLAVVIFLMAAPAALADASGGYTVPNHPTPAITGPCCDPPDPGASFLSSTPRSYWKQFDQPPLRMVRKQRSRNRQWPTGYH
jgi:hypothetical protein